MNIKLYFWIGKFKQINEGIFTSKAHSKYTNNKIVTINTKDGFEYEQWQFLDSTRKSWCNLGIMRK